MYLSLESKNNPNNSFSMNSSYKRDNLNDSLDKKIDVERAHSRVNRVESMKSNIFNSEMKTKENLKFKPEIKNKIINDEKTEKPAQNKVYNKSNISTVFDWTRTNTEVVFKRKQSEANIDEKYSPALMKRRNLVSELDDSNVKNFKSIQLKGPDESEIQKQEITDVIREKFGSNQARIKKNMDTISVLHTHDTYMNNLKSIFSYNKSRKRTEKANPSQLKTSTTLTSLT
jgi:hypothetical protein